MERAVTVDESSMRSAVLEPAAHRKPAQTPP